MNDPLRFGTPDDLDGIWEVFRLGFGARDRDREAWMSAVDPDRCVVVAGPRGEVAAASHVRPFGQWFGGRPVPLAGYSPVAVLPEFRGRGWARAVTAGHYDDLRQRGEVVAGLFPASLALYRSVGFELAGSYVARRLAAADVAGIRPSRPVEVRRGTPADVEAVHRCYEGAGAQQDGLLVRPVGWWSRRLPPELGDALLYVVDGPSPDVVAGYAIARRGPGREPFDYSMSVTEVVAHDPDVLRALWRVVGSSGSQAPDLHVIGPAEDDLLLLLDHHAPDTVRSEIRWMLRLVDLPAAVAARGWNPLASGRVEVAVTDVHAPWNDGRWTIEVDGGEARATPGGAGTVEVTIGALSSWWAGYASASRLARTGGLASSDPVALRAMDGLAPAGAPPVLLDFY